ncbi:DUF2878 domain-containing protein [Litoribrevibacter albus]|uniref:Membrane protein n=1 Tax=Litoribrevibacter albus TaxID=1473156 RepID=A0AA37S9P7_9GAMM|nr:DUF2878 domain-containing protein [Litoribrevibacter albus]GLQ30798.1 membrane protein [Litoribrevibacter albus]
MRSIDARYRTRISSRAKDVLINALLFQACWFMAIYQIWPLMMVPLFAILGHYFQSSTNCTRDFNVMIMVFLIGVLADTLFLQLGVYSFPGHPSPEWVGSFSFAEYLETIKGSFAPDWLLVLWAAFATTITRSLYWMFTRPLLAYAVLTLGGPLAYVAGRACGAIEFSNSDLGLMMVLWFWITHLCRKFLIAFDS